MTRKQFIKHLALLAAHTPASVAAYVKHYTVNCPKTRGRLVAIDEIMISGMAARSLRLQFDLMRDKNTKIMTLAINAFGGIVRWVPTPDQKILAVASRGWSPVGRLSWRITSPDTSDPVELNSAFVAHISFIDQKGERKIVPLRPAQGRI